MIRSVKRFVFNVNIHEGGALDRDIDHAAEELNRFLKRVNSPRRVKVDRR